jgi:hypothetical protein
VFCTTSPMTPCGVALQASLPWIDLAQRFAPRCRKSKCEYLYPRPAPHPRRARLDRRDSGRRAAGCRLPSLAPE